MKTLHVTLLHLFLIGSTLQNPCEDNIPQIQRVRVHGTAYVPCPKFEGKEITFSLYHGSDHSSVRRNFTHVKEPEPVGIRHHLNATNNSTMFVLYNVTEDQTGLYSCVALTTFPPPLLQEKTGPKILVIVEETCQQTYPRCEPPTNDLSLWVGLGVLIIYGLMITFTAFSLKFRLTRVDLDKHDYMNVRPRGRRRNQGILHPARLSWYNDTTSSIATYKLSSKRLQN